LRELGTYAESEYVAQLPPEQVEDKFEADSSCSARLPRHATL
jgi:hypothetical protein